jgi:hypothetical protein
MDFEPLLLKPINPGIALAARYIQEIAAGSALPKRRDFRPSRVPSILGFIYLIDVLPDQKDYHFSLFGEHMAVLYGQNVTNKYLSDMIQDGFCTQIRRSYEDVIATHSFHYTRGRYTWPDRFVNIERLLMPMADNDGNLNSIIGLTIPDTPIDTLHIFAGIGAARMEIDEKIIG